MQAVLISIQPGWCKLIALGKKTVEIRKTKPKLETMFKVYIYCTKEKPTFTQSAFCEGISNGKVIGEFICDCMTPLYNVCTDDWSLLRGGLHAIEKQLVGMACLTEEELHEYSNGKYCYAWHISDLKIYDKPKELSKFISSKPKNKFRAHGDNLTRPPQSWCYVEELK